MSLRWKLLLHFSRKGQHFVTAMHEHIISCAVPFLGGDSSTREMNQQNIPLVNTGRNVLKIPSVTPDPVTHDQRYTTVQKLNLTKTMVCFRAKRRHSLQH